MKNHPMILANSEPSQLMFNATGAVEIEAGMEADGKPKIPTFKINAYNGGPMNLAGWFNPVIIDLAGMKAMSQEIPILLNHDHDRIVGQTRKVAIDAEGVNLAGNITGSADDPDVAKVVGHSKGGFKWQASVGANPTRREFLEAGKTATVNGRQVSGPLVIARESILFETSFVAVGADTTTSADIAASHSNPKDRDMNFENWLKAKGIDITKADDAMKAVIRAAFDAEVAKITATPAPTTAPTPAPTTAPATPTVTAAAPAPATTTDLDAILAASAAESARRNAIADMTAKVARERPDLSEQLRAASAAAFADKSITAEQYQLTMIRTTNTAPAVIIGRGATDISSEPEVLEAAICLSTGLQNIEKAYPERVLHAAQRSFRHGIGLCEMLQIAAKKNGNYEGSTRPSLGLLRAAFAPIQAGFSTVSLPDILSNVANKYVAQAFTAVESSWRAIARKKSVRNFQQTKSVTLTGDFTFAELPPGGQIKHAVPGDEAYTNQAKTYARKLAVTRQDIINDDIGALTIAPTLLGRGAALKLNNVFWAAFMDNASFFTAGRGNYDEDTDTALAITGLGLADTLFRNLTDPDGEPLGIAPKILLVPNALVVTAKGLMNSTEIRDTTSSTKYGTNNPFAGNFNVVSSSYLSNSNFTGYSTTAWYLLADPNDLPVIEVAFLNGQEMPTIESADADFNELGIQMRGYHDFGAEKQEYRAGVKMAGVNVP